MFKNRFKKGDATSGYEGKEHVKYKTPGMTKHKIRYPEDEPHMKGRESKAESHQAEDDFHMKTKITEMKLPKKIPRAHMAMEDDYDPSERYGNLVSETGKPVKISSNGQEKMGPKSYQSDDESKDSERKDENTSKEIRKKVIAGVLKKKMKRE